MKEVLLSAKNLVKQFPSSLEPVLNQVNVEIYAGDFTVIMGPSGAGKSTLLYVLSGMDTVTEGTVSYRGTEMASLSEKQMAVMRAKELGFVFQQTHLVSNLTLLENVTVAGYLDKAANRKETEKRARELLNRMEVEDAESRLPSQTSGGEAQRAAIARAVINQPGLLFADEPTGALNKRSSESVLDLLSKLNRNGQSILMVTHDLRAAVRANRILYLEDGKILDELILDPYEEGSAKGREETVNQWLSSLSW